MANNNILYDKNEKYIDFIDLICYMPRHWKWVLLSMALLAFVFGFFGHQGNIVSESRQLELHSGTGLTEEERETVFQSVKKYKDYEQIYDGYEQYCNDAIIMNLNPRMFYRADIGYQIISETGNSAATAYACQNRIMNAEFYDLLSRNLEIDKEVYWQDVVDVKIAEAGDMSALMTISVSYFDKDVCEKVEEIVSQWLSASKKQIEQKTGNYETKLIYSNVSQVSDWNLVTTCREHEEEKNRIQDRMKKLSNGFTEEMLLHYNFLLSENSQEQPQFSESMDVKNVLLGMVLGAMLSIVILMITYYFNPKIHTKKEVDNCINAKVLSVLSDQDVMKRKKRESFFDKVRVEEVQEGSIDFLSLQIETMLRDTGNKEIYVSGSLEIGENFDKELSVLSKALSEKGINLIAGTDIVKNVDGMKKAVVSKNIMFVEMLEKSKLRDLHAEVEKAQNYGLNVMGIVLKK